MVYGELWFADMVVERVEGGKAHVFGICSVNFVQKYGFFLASLKILLNFVALLCG